MFKLMSTPPPPDYHRGGRARKYPFADMEVGQMFFVPNRTSNTLMSIASRNGSMLGRRFETRMVHMRMVDDGWELCDPTDKGAVRGIGVYRTR